MSELGKFHRHISLDASKIGAFGKAIGEYSALVKAGKGPAAVKTYPGAELVKLPASATGAGLSLARAMGQRRTRRNFSDKPVDLSVLAGVFRLSAGITGKADLATLPPGAQAELRAWPTAGGVYPLEVYVVPFNVSGLKSAVYHHNPFADALEVVGVAPGKAELEKSVFATGLWANAAMAVVITGVFERSAAKYGDRAYCYIQQEAGHLMQNILLACEEYALAIVPLGGFYEETVGGMLKLDSEKESPVYVAIVGG